MHWKLFGLFFSYDEAHTRHEANRKHLCRRTAEISVPLWHRATEEVDSSTTGSVLYSDLIGHTYSVLVGPKRAAKK